MADPQTRYQPIPAPDNSGVRASGAGDDIHSTTEWTYFLLGCATLLPWNALVNGTSFFLSRLDGFPLYSTFGSYLTSVYSVAKLACQLYCTITSKQSRPSHRISVSILFMICFMASLCLSTCIRSTQPTFFLFVLFNTAVLAASAGCLCTATFAGASLLGPSSLRSMLSGQSAIAVVVSAVQLVSSIISLWCSPPRSVSLEIKGVDGVGEGAEEVAARIFFGVSTVLLAITLIVYARLARQPHYKLATCTLEHHEPRDVDERTGLIADDHGNTQTEAHWRVYQVFKENLVFMFSIVYVMTVTLAVFPAITVYVQSVNPGIHPLLFTGVHIMLLNVGDLAGRQTCAFPRLLVWSAQKILAMSLSRTLFIPLILLCNVQWPGTTTQAPPIINSDALFMIIMFAMGYTNGYVLALAALAASSVEHNPRLKGRRKDVDVAAALAGFSVTVGITVGSLCSFGVQAII